LFGKLGARMPTKAVHRLRLVAGYVAVGRWVADNGWLDTPRVASRNRVFDAMIAEVEGAPITYLEFGVYKGASLRYWAEHVEGRESEFCGFDSFEGLPETFDAAYPASAFDLGGRTPRIDDSRVRFQVGWFENTLPAFTVPQGKRLVITLDADLYSATKLVLTSLDEHIRPGTLIYFDELSRFRPIVFERTLNTGAFLCV
jgi:hypothetical protein